MSAALLLLASGRANSATMETPRPLPEASVAEVNRNANGNQYQIGDRITLEARIPSGLLEPGESIRMSEDSEKENPQWLLDPYPELLQGSVRFIVAPVQTGDLELPKLRIVSEGRGPVAVTGAYRIRVSGPTTEPGKSPELFPVLEVALSWTHRILLVIFALLLAMAAFLLYRRIRRQRPSAPGVSVPSAPVETPDEIAIRRIETLFREHPYSRLALKPVCFGCSEILKDFFSSRFKVEASESTTREMLSLLTSAGVESDSLREIETLFTTLDLVKFTREENFAHLNEVDFASLRTGALLIISRWRAVAATGEIRS
jgi:hypothetical protein